MLQLQSEEPPTVLVTWQAPRQTYGDLLGYKVSYGIKGDPNNMDTVFDGEQYRFESRFLGKHPMPLAVSLILECVFSDLIVSSLGF